MDGELIVESVVFDMYLQKIIFKMFEFLLHFMLCVTVRMSTSYTHSSSMCYCSYGVGWFLIVFPVIFEVLNIRCKCDILNMPYEFQLGF